MNKNHSKVSSSRPKGRMAPWRYHAHSMFTLLELLVVIAVIAILVALLLPALSRAKYQAKLVVCTSNLHQTAIAVTLYTADNDLWYPYRKNVLGPKHGAYSPPYILRYLGDASTDDTQAFRDMGLEEITCPFNTINWDDINPSSIGAGYSYYFGWSATYDGDPECRLLKQGQEMRYRGDTFEILASDILMQRDFHGLVYSGHPDYGTGRLTPNCWAECWQSGDSLGRGPVDMNFLATDGSVFRLNRVGHPVDSRLRKLPYKNANVNTDVDYNLLPPAQ